MLGKVRLPTSGSPQSLQRRDPYWGLLLLLSPPSNYGYCYCASCQYRSHDLLTLVMIVFLIHEMFVWVMILLVWHDIFCVPFKEKHLTRPLIEGKQLGFGVTLNVDLVLGATSFSFTLCVCQLGLFLVDNVLIIHMLIFCFSWESMVQSLLDFPYIGCYYSVA